MFPQGYCVVQQPWYINLWERDCINYKCWFFHGLSVTCKLGPGGKGNLVFTNKLNVSSYFESEYVCSACLLILKQYDKILIGVFHFLFSHYMNDVLLTLFRWFNVFACWFTLQRHFMFVQDRDRKLRIFAGDEHPFNDRPLEPYVMPPRQVREMRPRARRATIRAQKKAEQQQQGTTDTRKKRKKEVEPEVSVRGVQVISDLTYKNQAWCRHSILTCWILGLSMAIREMVPICCSSLH